MKKLTLARYCVPKFVQTEKTGSMSFDYLGAKLALLIGAN
mgnify:CR=1 FL=1